MKLWERKEIMNKESLKNIVIVFLAILAVAIIAAGYKYGSKLQYKLLYEECVKETIREEFRQRSIDKHIVRD